MSLLSCTCNASSACGSKIKGLHSVACVMKNTRYITIIELEVFLFLFFIFICFVYKNTKTIHKTNLPPMGYLSERHAMQVVKVIRGQLRTPSCR